ncbi:hypothetical protein A2863_01400 [Candidatus Woesebacteria bacterium RIFCSPHIGHO2_01_FULL_38_9b]|uniref:Uncharacterized protein n=1 Tax=Candidatus Woesebacteria bacterium RIFCSPHIGHO2_01_FULL_38_9b TaxID=1802493 RepID=A0A1F7XZK2_9BACT|nr:MAG: hypothetical protein A2863_01400 [Candidatus Woesebacteria bacterium RIFCSPHIGHO2_01_FULL_38_9b]
MTEAKHRFTTFEEGYHQLRERWHNFEVGSPEFQALCDFNDRSNFDQRRESALQVHANAKKDNLQLDIQVILETNLDYYTLRLTQTQERIEQRLSTITGYALALKRNFFRSTRVVFAASEI